MININWVSQAKHSISQALQIRFAKAEVIWSLFQPLAEPGCTLGWLPICVRSYQEHTDVLAGCLLYNREQDRKDHCSFRSTLHPDKLYQYTENWKESEDTGFFVKWIAKPPRISQEISSCVPQGPNKNTTAKLDIHLPYPTNSFLNKLLQWQHLPQIQEATINIYRRKKSIEDYSV